ncbi:hypothetical protein PUN28_000170 [Cardiocondyla obscurior]|uniref:Ribosomal protein L14 n=1 Tax=Cardiocondyla obscurior TaxID=286306 RepID=A0AAW2GYD5_9HYME
MCNDAVKILSENHRCAFAVSAVSIAGLAGRSRRRTDVTKSDIKRRPGKIFSDRAIFASERFRAGVLFSKRDRADVVIESGRCTRVMSARYRLSFRAASKSIRATRHRRILSRRIPSAATVTQRNSNLNVTRFSI